MSERKDTLLILRTLISVIFGGCLASDGYYRSVIIGSSFLVAVAGRCLMGSRDDLCIGYDNKHLPLAPCCPLHYQKSMTFM
jgi:hypothetical protein